MAGNSNSGGQGRTERMRAWTQQIIRHADIIWKKCVWEEGGWIYGREGFSRDKFLLSVTRWYAREWLNIFPEYQRWLRMR